MGGGVYLHNSSSFEHHTGEHPEQPKRITAIEEKLASCDWFGYRREEARSATKEQLEAVHESSYIDSVRSSCLQEQRPSPETVVSEGSWQAALDSAGGAVQMVEMLLCGDVVTGFCGLRPPGHHATTTQAMGFCLFNNVAIAAQYALEELGCERVMVLDWDVHHGNGTNDIFYDTDTVLFCSIHQMPLYPGSGEMQSHGCDKGEGYTVNLPVPPGTGELEYLSLMEHLIEPIARSFKPDLILVSAGYDAHVDDPLALIELTESSYSTMTSRIRQLSEELEAPFGFALEGGYNLEALAVSVAATMEAAVSEGVEAKTTQTVERLPVAERAVEYFQRWWP